MPLADEDVRALLVALGEHVRARVLAGRDAAGTGALGAVDRVDDADTLYAVDRFGEDALVEWFAHRWPADEPVEVVAEGLRGATGDGAIVVPEGTPPAAARWTCVVDPIDGTRALMHDKRAAWSLAAAAPRRGARPRLRDLTVAAMTELPPTKQRLADSVSGIRGAGRAGLRAERVDLDTGARRAIPVRPSTATDLRHGFAAVTRFFPEAKELLARFEAVLWRELYRTHERSPARWLEVFDDQYLATGGQFHELLAGHDRFLADVRPLAHAELGLDGAMACHPYDACTGWLLTEAGAVLTDPWGAPLDTTTPVAWVGVANAALATRIRPALDAALAECFPATRPV